ncbi:MAG TPA: hypothetical protein VFL77_09245 [Solirubrobacterales bacterium]|nr:hypothetical protein [Solirubrobacterales bacterium]
MVSKRVSLLLVAAALTATMLLGVIATQAEAALRHIDGTVLSKNGADRTFKMTTQGGTVRIKVTSSTKFQRLSGFGALRKGLRIEVEAKSTANGLVAIQVETRQGGGADENGGGGGGADDGANHA